MRAPLKRQKQPRNSSTPASYQAESGVLPEHMLSTPAWNAGQNTPLVWLLQALSWNSDLNSDGKLLQPFLMAATTHCCVSCPFFLSLYSCLTARTQNKNGSPSHLFIFLLIKALVCPALSSAWRQHHVWVGTEVPPRSEQLNISPLLGTQQLNPLLLQQPFPSLLSHFTLHHCYSVFALASSSMYYSLSTTF